MKTKALQLSCCIAFYLLASCGTPTPVAIAPTPSPFPSDAIIYQNQRTEKEFLENIEIPLENCNGSRPASSQINRERSTTTTIELGVSAGLEAGIAEVVKANVAVQFDVSEGETRTASQNVTVEVDAGNQIIYELTWYETWQVGDAVIDSLNLTLPYRIRTGVQGELRSSTPTPCPIAVVIATDILPPQIASDTPIVTIPTATNMPSATPTQPPQPTQLLAIATVFVSAATATQGYPCEGQIISRIPETTMLNVVRLSPSTSAPSNDPIQQSTKIIILERLQKTLTEMWYRTANMESKSIGWILSQYVVLSKSCPE
jgi:hypothetical protein